MVHPANQLCVTYYVNLLKGGKSMHTPGAQVSKSMHPAAKMCTQGAPLICETTYYTKKHRGGCTSVSLRPGSNRTRSLRLVIRC